jgi:U3 small nucleolar RNA-associated protein 20
LSTPNLIFLLFFLFSHSSTSLLQKFTHDLRDTLAPAYSDILRPLLILLKKTISPASLTSLLTTFTTVFKHLLIPNNSLLKPTWIEIRGVLTDCLPDVQRTFAEVWGSVLRRLRVSAREDIVIIMVDDMKNLDDMVAWAFVSACKVCILHNRLLGSN